MDFDFFVRLERSADAFHFGGQTRLDKIIHEQHADDLAAFPFGMNRYDGFNEIAFGQRIRHAALFAGAPDFKDVRRGEREIAKRNRGVDDARELLALGGIDLD